MDTTAKKFQKDLNSCLVALVLLSILDRAAGELYGYEIAKQLHRDADGEPLFKEGTVYPVLRTLSASGLLSSRVEPSLAGPPRKYYRITESGRAVLREWLAIWKDTRNFVDRFTRQGKES
jgi:PadR family transcriptional regulator PadR